MGRSSMIMVGVLSAACAREARPVRDAESPHAQTVGAASAAPAEASGTEPQTRESALAAADSAYVSRLGSRAALFEVDRQVTETTRAIALYERFIELAGDDPRMQDAVRRSRERISDLREAIGFILEQGDAGAPEPSR